MIDWSNYPNFSAKEFACQCGECDGSLNLLEEHLVSRLQALRDKVGFGISISSGIRCHLHPIEAAKAESGRLSPHSTGMAVDIPVRGNQAYAVLKHATDLGFQGIGVSQQGASRFIHLDLCTESMGYPRPWVWSY